MFTFDLDTGEIFLYDYIGPEWMGLIGAGAFKEAISEIGDKRLTVRINSGGGVIDEGVAIYNMLKRHTAGVDTVVDSLAASLASHIMLAGESRTIARNAKMMIHDPRLMFAGGTAKELRKLADELDVYQESVVQDYADASGKTVEQINEIMEAETWYTSSQAVENGFATAIDGEAIAPAAIAPGQFRHTPKELIASVDPGSRTPYPVKRERARTLARMYGEK